MYHPYTESIYIFHNLFLYLIGFYIYDGGQKYVGSKTDRSQVKAPNHQLAAFKTFSRTHSKQNRLK